MIIRIDVHGAGGVLRGLAAITALKEDAPQKDVRVDQLGVPEDGGLQSADRGFLITCSLMNTANQQVSLGIHRLFGEHLAEFRQRFVITPGCVKLARLDEQVFRIADIGCVNYFLCVYEIEKVAPVKGDAQAQWNARSSLRLLPFRLPPGVNL